MDWTITLLSLAAVVALVVFCGWRGAQAPNPARGPRLFPYRLVMLLGAALVFVLVVHMAGLADMLPQRPGF